MPDCKLMPSNIFNANINEITHISVNIKSRKFVFISSWKTRKIIHLN